MTLEERMYVVLPIPPSRVTQSKYDETKLQTAEIPRGVYG